MAGRVKRVAAMMAGSHVAVGLVAWAWAAPHLGLHAGAPVEVALAGFGALLPDIDHPRSWVGQRAAVVSRPLSWMVGHRGLTHSLLAVALCWAGLRGGMHALWAPLAVGYLSHLVADALTPAGLRLAWPLRRRWGVPVCRTGSPAEPLIVGALVLWAAARLLR